MRLQNGSHSTPLCTSFPFCFLLGRQAGIVGPIGSSIIVGVPLIENYSAIDDDGTLGRNSLSLTLTLQTVITVCSLYMSRKKVPTTVKSLIAFQQPPVPQRNNNGESKSGGDDLCQQMNSAKLIRSHELLTDLPTKLSGCGILQMYGHHCCTKVSHV